MTTRCIQQYGACSWLKLNMISACLDLVLGEARHVHVEFKGTVRFLDIHGSEGRPWRERGQLPTQRHTCKLLNT